ncbi:IclR family transcriptional regulator [uncultured Microbacterium sp.]|uniref:IclR family transcriptional regulator n=1 Tax=uncultured Microbacterium sp. TaxID=191216 RepID=UPI002618CBE2|nr:IclR family transcriptional regulator [uncultured Microbacterium sp.]
MTLEATPLKPADSTTARVSEVLLAFAGAEKPLGITDIARATGLSKAVVHRIVQELCNSSFVWQNPETRKYQPGISAFALSDAANQSSQFRRIGLELLADLAEHTGETATLSGRIGHRRIYIGQVESSQLVRISVQVGSALPLTIGASGAAILAFLPPNEIEATLNSPVRPGDWAEAAPPEVLRERLRIVAEQGYARSEGERIADATSFAAPARNRFGEVIGCVSVAALASRLTPERERDLAAQVVKTADELSARMAAQR